MRLDWSFSVSLMIHAAILASALIVLPTAKPFEVEERSSIVVDIITDKSTRAPTQKDAPKPPPEAKIAPPKPPEPVPETPKPAPTPEPPKPAPTPTPAAPEPPPPPEPKAEAEPIQKAEEAPKPKPEPPKPKPKPPKPKPKKDVNVDELAALLNKIPDAQTPPPASEENGVPLEGDINSLLGTDGANSADLVDYLVNKVKTCWSPPTGVMEAQDLVVVIHVEFAQDANVIGTPEVVSTSSHPLAQVAASAAVRAIMSCAPYDKFPPDRYNEWKEAEFTFNPAKMFGQ